MIDFQNANYVKLRPVAATTFEKRIGPMLLDDETVLATFQGVRDGVVFTNKRIISINVQGVTGKKKNYTSLPYRQIQAFSIETASVVDLDSELELWFSGLGKVSFEFVSNADLPALCRVMSTYIL